MVCLTQPPTQILQLPSGGYSSKPVLLGRGFSGELGAPGTRLESCSRLSTGTAHWGMVIPCFLGRRSKRVKENVLPEHQSVACLPEDFSVSVLIDGQLQILAGSKEAAGPDH